MANHEPRDPPTTAIPSATTSESNYSPRGSLLDDFSPHSLRLASSHAARTALPFRQPTSSTLTDTHHNPHRRESRASTLSRVTSSIRRLAFSPDTPDDWTVFGQVMAHEAAPSTPARAIPIPVPGAGETGDTSHWAHSPVSEFFHHEGQVVEEEAERPVSDDGNVDSDTEPLKDIIREEDTKPAVGAGLLSRVPTLPTLYRNILKCSLAYFLGSLFTYYTPLSRLIVELTQDGPGEKYPSATGHMVATVYVSLQNVFPPSSLSDIAALISAVYYNPAKTIGGMLEADIYCVMGLGFASFISLGSMYSYWALEPHAGWEWLADSLVLIWICVGMSLVAWFKLWIAKPTFNPGRCRALSLVLFFWSDDVIA
jgi:hypothetical protein